MDGTRIVPGDFYEDCRYMPMLCIKADYEDGNDEPICSFASPIVVALVLSPVLSSRRAPL